MSAGAAGSFGARVRRVRADGNLVVQARMGMSDPARMRQGLLAVKQARAATVGTITVDSFTRTGDLAAVGRAVADLTELNGYPIATYRPAVTRALLDGIADEGFPVQVRHGSAAPWPIVSGLLAAGLHATEGGPVSYCLPYGRTPLRDSVRNWRQCCQLLASARTASVEPHLETFGGCMMGQLCPPGLLVALSVLEAMFFRAYGLRDVSLSYAQQGHADDEDAVFALRALAAQLLPDMEWHIVIYTYMGMYPRTPQGCGLLLDASARLCADTGAERLIVKTSAEAFRIPTVAENVAALERAARAAKVSRAPAPPQDSEVLEEARALVEAVLGLHADVGEALTTAFARGYLDVPYCLHPDNAGRARSVLDDRGRPRWADVGSMPISTRSPGAARRVDSAGFLASLTHVARRFDSLAVAGHAQASIE